MPNIPTNIPNVPGKDLPRIGQSPAKLASVAESLRNLTWFNSNRYSGAILMAVTSDFDLLGSTDQLDALRFLYVDIFGITFYGGMSAAIHWENLITDVTRYEL